MSKNAVSSVKLNIFMNLYRETCGISVFSAIFPGNFCHKIKMEIKNDYQRYGINL